MRERGVRGPKIFEFRPSEELIRGYRDAGVWRSVGPLDDLRRWREETPDAPAVVAYRAGHAQRLTYREYERFVERFAGALNALGVGSGQVVAVQLPNFWQLGALIFACARVGAVVAPITVGLGPRELERTLARIGAAVCVTVDRWNGAEHAERVSKMAPRLPALRHRVVLGESTPGDEVDFIRHFEETPWERRHPMVVNQASEDPDRGAVVLFTSGISGEPKGVLHSFNTLIAGARPVVVEEGIGPRDRIFTPQEFSHVFGIVYGILIPLLSGGAAVFCDTWDSEAVPAMLADSDVTVFAGVPRYLGELIEATVRTRARFTPRLVFCGATTVPGQLVTRVPSLWGVQLRTLWGMTEVPGHTWTRGDDPPLWGAHSGGRPGCGLEIDLRSEGPVSAQCPARLFVRGGGVGLATLGRDSGRLWVVAEHDDGWLDTGDLAVPDGRGGLRMISRASDRIGGTCMIPVNDVETELLDHPDVAEVALIGYPDGEGGELACAVVVSQSPVLSLEELRDFLLRRGMTEWYLPSRLELIGSLPRNSVGKVHKELLRGWLRSAPGVAASASPPRYR